LLTEQYPDIKLLQVESIEECFNAISSGQVDGCICSYVPAVYIARSHGYSDIAMVSEIQEFADKDYYLAVKSNKAILDNIMKKVFSALPENELLNLKQKYSIETLTVNSISYLTFVIWSVFALVFISAVMFVFSLYLRRLRQQAQQEQENLRITFESLHDAIIITDLNGTVMQMNTAAHAILKVSAGQGLPVGSVFDFVSEDQVSIEQICKNILKADSQYCYKANGRVTLDDGQVIHVSLGVTMVVGGTSGLHGAVLVIRDITSSYLVQQQLKIVEQERELILNNIPVGICFLDKDFRILKINRQMEKYFERTASEVCGLKCHKAWFNRSKACSDCVARQAAESLKVCKGRPPYPMGDAICEMVVVPILEDGKLSGLLEMMIDITEYTRVRKELESAYSKLKSHSVKLVSLVEERSQELLKSNRELSSALHELKTAQSILILSEKMAALGQLIAGIAHEINTPLGAIGSSGENISSSVLVIIDNMHKLAQWLRGQEGSQIAGLLSESLNLPVENVMTTREYRARRRKIEDQLQSSGVIDCNEIASYITDSHLGDNWQDYLSLFKEPDIMEKLDVIIRIHDIVNSCNTIETAIQKASRIVLALKNYIHAGSDDGKAREEKKQIDIRSCLETVLTLFHNKLKNGIELELEFNEVPEVWAYSDELNQVWTNLIQNAVYAMSGKGKLVISVNSSDEGISVSITDNGCGMTQEVKARMFEPLYTTKPVGEGTGLGMDIVRRIVVDDHGGKIEVESEPGKGTTVTVWLPLGVPQVVQEHVRV
ncbi:MAG: PAS domain S-box protein, partial [Sedimentisphaerales bacterium]|nr:PAS domain S-box protein [Sedimentisphaerales bacterium]